MSRLEPHGWGTWIRRIAVHQTFFDHFETLTRSDIAVPDEPARLPRLTADEKDWIVQCCHDFEQRVPTPARGMSESAVRRGLAAVRGSV